MEHTGSDVYKGMVGLYPIYDPKNGMDTGDERQGLPTAGGGANSSRFFPDPKYKVPVLKFVIGDTAPDDSQIPAALRPLPPLPGNWQTMLDNRMIFEVKRGTLGGGTGAPSHRLRCGAPTG
jgi:hypothetical protein